MTTKIKNLRSDSSELPGPISEHDDNAFDEWFSNPPSFRDTSRDIIFATVCDFFRGVSIECSNNAAKELDSIGPASLHEKKFSSGLDNKIEIENTHPNREVSIKFKTPLYPVGLRDNSINYMLGKDKASPVPPKKQKVSHAENTLCQITITDDDVLLGRGGKTNHHLGNIRFRDMARDLKPWYTKLKKDDKKPISKMLVRKVHENSGRFLKKDSSGRWYEVEEERARKKASQALRELEGDEKCAKKKASQKLKEPFA